MERDVNLTEHLRDARNELERDGYDYGQIPNYIEQAADEIERLRAVIDEQDCYLARRNAVTEIMDRTLKMLKDLRMEPFSDTKNYRWRIGRGAFTELQAWADFYYSERDMENPWRPEWGKGQTLWGLSMVCDEEFEGVRLELDLKP